MHELDEYCDNIDFTLSAADALALGLVDRPRSSKHYLPPILAVAVLLIFFLWGHELEDQNIVQDINKLFCFYFILGVIALSLWF